MAFEQVDTFFEFIPLAEDSLAPTEEEVLDSFRAGATLLTAWAAEAAPQIRDEAGLYAENVSELVNLYEQGLEGDRYEEAVEALEETLGGARQTQERPRPR